MIYEWLNEFLQDPEATGGIGGIALRRQEWEQLVDHLCGSEEMSPWGRRLADLQLCGMSREEAAETVFQERKAAYEDARSGGHPVYINGPYGKVRVTLADDANAARLHAVAGQQDREASERDFELMVMVVPRTDKAIAAARDLQAPTRFVRITEHVLQYGSGRLLDLVKGELQLAVEKLASPALGQLERQVLARLQGTDGEPDRPEDDQGDER